MSCIGGLFLNMAERRIADLRIGYLTGPLDVRDRAAQQRPIPLRAHHQLKIGLVRDLCSFAPVPCLDLLAILDPTRDGRPQAAKWPDCNDSMFSAQSPRECKVFKGIHGGNTVESLSAQLPQASTFYSIIISQRSIVKARRKARRDLP